MNTALLTSNRGDWNTPQNVLDLVRAVGTIGLDPCSNAGSIVGATASLNGRDETDSGLTCSWRCDRLAFLNPPYGREIGKWLAKCSEEASRGAEIIALLPARPDTAWWQDHAAKADAICFWRGRLTFLGAPSPAPFPSAVVYWGVRPYRFADAFVIAGWVVMP